MKVIRVHIDVITIAVKSIEVDLELPRGYVAKIKDVFLIVRSAGITGTLAIDYVFAALVRDPDDGATVAIPDNEVQHDVIMDIITEIIYDTTTGFGFVTVVGARKHLKFHNPLFDVITARNMRLNASATVDTSHSVVAEIYYTLEKITKTETLELLDIL